LQQSYKLPKFLSKGENTAPLIGVLTQPLSDS